MKKLDHFVDVLGLVLARIAGVLLCITLLAVVGNIIGRKLFHTTIPGIIELVQYMMLLIMCLGMIRTTYNGGHVAVTMITGALPKKLGDALVVLGLVFSAVIVGLGSYVAFKYVPVNYASGLTTDTYHIPMYLVYVVMGCGLGAGALTFLYNAVKVIFPVPKDEKPAAAEE